MATEVLREVMQAAVEEDLENYRDGVMKAAQKWVQAQDTPMENFPASAQAHKERKASIIRNMTSRRDG